MTKRIDITGQRFGRWTVISYVKSYRWLCRCDCGSVRAIHGLTLRDGRSKSCGCRRIDWQHHDLSGQRFGRLTVVRCAKTRATSSGNRSMFLCQCECGKQKIVLGSSLVCGATKSCGCLKPALTHGEASPGKETTEYRSWSSMMSRCHNRGHESWENYGGRGIKVCARWRSYENFLADMGRKPAPTHSIDRIDVDGDYEPTNCRWATKKEQVQNRRPFRVRRLENFTTAELVRELARRRTTT